MNPESQGNPRSGRDMDGEVDRALTAAGARWRSAQQPPPDVDTARLLEAVRGRRLRAWAPLAAVAGVAAVLAVVVLPVVLRGDGGAGTDIGAPGGGSPGAGPVGTGEMEGIGTLLREADGTTKLCASVIATMSLPPTGAACSPVFVLVTGVEDRWFTQEATSGQAWSESVRVEGSYSNGTLAVRQVEPFHPDVAPQEPAVVPCEPPAGGWAPGQNVDERANALSEYVRARPDRFTDVWVGYPDGPPTMDTGADVTSPMVYVVGTTGDVEAAGTELEAIFPGNLCVHPVAYSAADLQAIADQLSAVSTTPIQADVMVIENKVRVKVVALDPSTNAVLDAVGRDALIIDEPLLRWLE